jgi:dolichol-phosphate mannosyltransferase
LKTVLTATGSSFAFAQAFATLIAAISNFFLNNWLTYRDRRLHGWGVLTGLISFLLVCSIGAVVNVAFADRVFQVTKVWWFAGIAGAAVSAILNYSATALFTWRKK